MTLQITTPFATPFGFVRHPNSQRLNADLRALFLARELEGARFANVRATMQVNPGLFESKFDLFRWTDPCVRELREFCWGQVYQFIGALNGLDAAARAKIRGHADAWFHITRRGGYFGLHNHPMASWSGVYSVDAGTDDAGCGNSGLLSFPHPNLAASMFKDPASTALKLPYGYETREYRLKPGELILFPSWLPHQVTPFQGEGERITVAFNAWFSVDPSAT